MKKVFILYVIAAIILCLFSDVTFAFDNEAFQDVPKGDWSEQYIYKLKELNVTTGKGKNFFGYNENITRAEFVTFLIRILGINTEMQQESYPFSDVKAYHWYAPYIGAALSNRLIIEKDYSEGQFKPNQFITREEIAIMVIRAIKLEELAIQLDNSLSPFEDVKGHIGYITLAKDFGIINGKSAEKYAPQDYALRQEAAAILVRMYNLLTRKVPWNNGFYAIQSYPQVEKMKLFDSVSFGWSRISYDMPAQKVKLVTQSRSIKNPYYYPEGYKAVLEKADQANVKKYLMVFGSNEDITIDNIKGIGIVSALLRDEQACAELIQTVADEVYNIQPDKIETNFDGVVIDFEGLRDEDLDKQKFVDFLFALKQELANRQKELLICVQPKRELGQAYFDGYDYKQIGEIADKVILMAHDYAPIRLQDEEIDTFSGDTPLAPIKDVYYAVKLATDQETGIPREKLLLQISLDAVQWQFKNERVLNSEAMHPLYDMIKKRMGDKNLETRYFQYSSISQAPYFTYYDEKKGIRNVIWYEDTRSLEAKVRIANLFSLQGISIWRLGLIPDFTDLPGQEQPHYLDVCSYLESIADKE